MGFIKNIIRKTIAVFGYKLYRASEHQVSFSNFISLTRAYEQCLNQSGKSIKTNEVRPILLARLLGTPPSEAYFIIQALAKCEYDEGDICEFGVAQGETSALIANEILPSKKSLHLFDSFEGLPKPTTKDELKDDIFSLGSMDAYTGTMSCPEAMVHARLRSTLFPQERVVIHKGFIDQILTKNTNLPKKVSFAYVDFDFYEPIKLTLEFLNKVTSKGAIIIVDDYDYFSTGAKIAVDEFLQENNSNKCLYDCFVPDTLFGYFAVLTRK